MESIPIPIPEASKQAFTLPPSVLIIVAVLAGVILLYSLIVFSRNRAKLRSEWQQEDIAREAKASGSTQMLPIPPNVAIKAKQVMSHKSLQVLELLENTVWDINSAFSVLVHCSMDRFLTQDSAGGNAAEQAKISRSLKSEVLDYLVINADGLPVLGVVYYTEGPSKSPRTSQDPSIPVITSALNHAGIRFLEIEPGFRPRDLKKRLKKTLKSGIL